jgi:hypothetical protein
MLTKAFRTANSVWETGIHCENVALRRQFAVLGGV